MRSNVIKEEDAEIYIYGINQILVSVLNVSSALIIGLILGMLLECLVFMVAYIPLRSFAGGYHAKTPERCYFASLLLIVSALLFCKYVPFNLFFYGSVLIISSIACAVLCPVQDNNKPLDSDERQRYRKISIVILLVEICSLIVIILTVHKHGQIISISIFTEAVMVIIGKVKNNLKKKALINHIYLTFNDSVTLYCVLNQNIH